MSSSMDMMANAGSVCLRFHLMVMDHRTCCGRR
jgi:hypothetical protein